MIERGLPPPPDSQETLSRALESPSWQIILVRNLPIPVRARNALLRASITTLKEFVQEPPSEKLNLRNVGPKTLDEIIIVVRELVPFWKSLPDQQPQIEAINGLDQAGGYTREQLYQIGVVGLFKIRGLGVIQAKKILDALYPIPPKYLLPKYQSHSPVAPVKTEKRPPTAILPFDICLPKNTPDYIGPADVLAGLIPELEHKINRRTYNRLSDLVAIGALFSILDGKLPRPKGLGKKSLADLRLALEAFTKYITDIAEKTPRTEGQPVVIEISPEDLNRYLNPPGLGKDKVPPQRKANPATVVAFVKKWRAEHPTRTTGAQKAAAKKFGISGERVRQILIKKGVLTARSLPRALIPLAELAQQLDTTPLVLRSLLSKFTIEIKGGGMVPVDSLSEKDLRRLKARLAEESTVERTMASLTLGRAEFLKKKRILLPLSQLTRQAGVQLRDVIFAFRNLMAAGFHLRVFKRTVGKRGKGFYYFAHADEAEAIIGWFRE